MNLRRVCSLLLGSLTLFSGISVGAIKDIHPLSSSESLVIERRSHRREERIVARYNRVLDKIYANKDNPEKLDRIYDKLHERQRAGTTNQESNYLSLILFVCVMYSNTAKIFLGITPSYKAHEDATEMITMAITYSMNMLSVLNHMNSEFTDRVDHMLTEVSVRLRGFNGMTQQ